TVPLISIYLLGGVNNTIASVNQSNPDFLNMFTHRDGTEISLISIISLAAWGLGYFGQPHILARFMAIRSSHQIRRARTIAMIWVVISLFCAVAVGIIGFIYLDQPLQGPDIETVFMVLVNHLFHPLLAGLLLAAILAAIMSTADSQLLVTSSALSEDFYRVLLRKNASDKELVWVSRLSVIGIAVIAFIIALNPQANVLNLVAYAWAGFGAAFGPLILLSLFWKRMTYRGALAGIIIGGLTVLIWKQLQGGIFDMYEIVPGFLFSAVAIIGLSLLDKAPSQEIIEEFMKVGNSNI
ncbi:MAG: sodium/proline symporter, partial [Calditrichia bacterium]